MQPLRQMWQGLLGALRRRGWASPAAKILPNDSQEPINQDYERS